MHSNLQPTGLRIPIIPETILTQLNRVHCHCYLFVLPLSTHGVHYLSRKVSACDRLKIQLQITQAPIFRGLSRCFHDIFRAVLSNGQLNFHVNGYMITHPFTHKHASLETLNRQRCGGRTKLRNSSDILVRRAGRSHRSPDHLQKREYRREQTPGFYVVSQSRGPPLLTCCAQL